MKEKEIEKWFEKNYKSLGFDKIEPNRKYNWAMHNYYLETIYGKISSEYPYWLKGKGEKMCPDYFGYKKRRKYGIELEVKASNFILHKHNPNRVDFLLVYEDDSKKCKDFPISEDRILTMLKMNIKINKKKSQINNIINPLETEGFLRKKM